MIIRQIKKNFPNIYRIIIAICIGLWFDGINMITHHLFPQTLTTGIILIFISLSVFYLDDGLFNELHSIDRNNNKVINNAAAISAYNY